MLVELSSPQISQMTQIKRKVLVGTLGYHNLRNHSLGPVIQPQLEAVEWPEGVTVDEMNWGPIAIVQQFEAMAEPYDRVVIVTASEKNRPITTITHYHWTGGLPSPQSIQDRVGDAVTGVISIDNLLVIGEYFGIWPQETLIIDVEPGGEMAGETLTAEMVAMVPAVIAVIEQAATAEWDELPPLEALTGAMFELYD